MVLKECLLPLASDCPADPDRLMDAPACRFDMMCQDDFDEIVGLVARSVKPGPLPWVIETLRFHKSALENCIDDGRHFFLLREHGRLLGLCGLHHYIWGPPSVCWASWFVVAPERRGTKAAARLGAFLLRTAKRMGFRKLYVETYSNDPTYASIADVLPRVGFRLEATLKDYVEPGVDSLIYSLGLV